MIERIDTDWNHPAFEAARLVASISGCVKAPVGACLYHEEFGVLGVGNNDTTHAGTICPRDVEGCESGEGYWMCRDLCRQTHHAEVGAVEHALLCNPARVLKGSTMFIWGHSYSCANCLSTMEKAGVTQVAFPTAGVFKTNPSIKEQAA